MASCTFNSAGLGLEATSIGFETAESSTTDAVDPESTSTTDLPPIEAGSLPLDSEGSTSTGLVVPECDPSSCAADEVCRTIDGISQCACPAGLYRSGSSCVPVTLETARVELPCLDVPECGGTNICALTPSDGASTTLVGDPAVLYDVQLRFRGVIETKTYKHGRQDGFFHTEGESDPSNESEYRISISDPEQIIFLNSASQPQNFSEAIDYERTVTMRGNAELELAGDRGIEVCGRDNGEVDADPSTRIVIPDIPPSPDPFDGQFLQIDLVSITESSTF